MFSSMWQLGKDQKVQVGPRNCHERAKGNSGEQLNSWRHPRYTPISPNLPSTHCHMHVFESRGHKALRVRETSSPRACLLLSLRVVDLA